MEKQKREAKLIIAQKELIIPKVKEFTGSRVNVSQNEDMISVVPKRDWILIDGYRQIQMKTGVSVLIPSKFKSSLETEQVI
jgi:hypothetical protein